MKKVINIFLIFLATTASAELSIQEKVNDKSCPSIFGPWAAWFVNRPALSYAEMNAYHDLFWSPEFGLRFQRDNTKVELIGDFIEARRQRDELLELNPDIILILEINMRGTDPSSSHLEGLYGDDFPFIVDNGELVLGTPPEIYTDILIDFTHPKAQEIIIKQAIAIAESGLWDGIMFDYWNEQGVILEGYRSYEAEQRARVNILQKIRASVSDDFLIIVNNGGRLTHATPYINGIYIETYREQWHNYKPEGLKQLENILLWAEEDLQEPQINVLQVEGIGKELPMSPRNLQDMRLMTTLSLTHSDGYVLYTMGVKWKEPHPHDDLFLNHRGPVFHRNPVYWTTHREQHDTFYHDHGAAHYWYDFWDADLGQPIGERGQRYENRKGLFIRKFTNGWAVYNRSGKEQTITLPIETNGVASGITATQHTVPDLDGEIYLKATGVPADINADGTVNVLDLVLVANAFGKAEPDLNGDGVVNILDLVIVANAFGNL